MEEIIATKRKYASKGAKFAIGIGVVIIILCVLALILYPVVGWRFTFLNNYEDWELNFAVIFGFVMGAVMIAVGGFMLYRAKRVPEVIIKYRDGVLYFGNGFSCRIEEVESVRCSSVHNLDVVLDSGYDILTIVVNGREMNFNLIENVKLANDRIIELMMESRERTSVKLDYKDKGE